MISDWANKRVTVMGLGRFGGGVGVTRWLAAQGARIVVTDADSPQRLSASLDQVRDLPINLCIGAHHEADFREADLIVVNPAVKPSNPYLALAADAGVPVTTEINLFVERVRARCIGITGTVGKSTTTAMLGHVLRETLGRQRVWVGGNIGRSLLDELPSIHEDAIVVLELSSFQLERTPLVQWSPEIAVLTNIAPNHVDWHGDLASYINAKLNVVRFQKPQDGAIIIDASEDLRSRVLTLVHDRGPAVGWAYDVDVDDAPMADRLMFPGRAPRVALSGGQENANRLKWPKLDLPVPGRHNRFNAAAALTAAHVAGIDPERAAVALATFESLPDRLQRVAICGGVTYFNDSKSSTPEAAVTAIRAIESPLLVILGGYDKGVDLTPVADVAASRTRFAACIGQTGPQICAAIRAAGGSAELFEDLPAAVTACRERARDGDVVLLSPACASWDQFVDYRERGALFTRLVRANGR